MISLSPKSRKPSEQGHKSKCRDSKDGDSHRPQGPHDDLDRQGILVVISRVVSLAACPQLG
jgi:hypothetical protein